MFRPILYFYYLRFLESTEVVRMRNLVVLRDEQSLVRAQVLGVQYD